MLGGRVLGAHVGGSPPYADPSRPIADAAMGDIEVVMLPGLAHFHREVAAGRVPLWSPFNGLGAPFLANQQSAVLHPFTWMTLSSDWRVGILILALLRWLLALWGTYGLARDLGCTRYSSLASGLTFSLSGSIIGWICYPVGGVFAHIPVLLFLAKRASERQQPGWHLLLGLVLVSSALSGHLEYLALIWILTAGVYLGCAALSLPSVVRICSVLAASSAACAAFLLPSVEYISQSLNFKLRTEGEAHFGFDPMLLIGTINWGMFEPAAKASFDAVGVHPIMARLPFVGSLAVALAFASLRLSRARRFVLLVALSCVLWMPSPLAPLISSAPVLSWMALDKTVVFTALGISLLTGLGLDVVSRDRSYLPVAGVGLAVATVFSGVAYGAPASVLPLMGGLVVSVLSMVRLPVRRELLALVALAACTAEHWAALGRFNVWERPEQLFGHRDVVDEVRARIGHDRLVAQGYVLNPVMGTALQLRDARAYDAIGVALWDQMLMDEGDHHWWGTRVDLPSRATRLAGAVALLWRDDRPLLRGRSKWTSPSPEVNRTNELSQPLPGRLSGTIEEIHLFVMRPREMSSPLMVSLLEPSGRSVFETSLKPRWLPEAGWKVVAVQPPVEARSLELKLLCDAPPGNGVRFGATKSESALRVNNRPTQSAIAIRVGHIPPVVAKSDGVQVSVDPWAFPRARLASRPRERGPVEFLRDEPHRVDLVAKAETRDRLILADALFPGWRAIVDGELVPIESEGPFRSVALGPGQHRVVMWYAPPSWRVGLFLTLMTLLGTGLVVVVNSRGEGFLSGPSGGHSARSVGDGGMGEEMGR